MSDDFVYVSNGPMDTEILQTINSLDEMEEGFEDPITTSNDFEWVTNNTMHDKILLQNILTETHALNDEMQQELLTMVKVVEERLEEIIMSNNFNNISSGIADHEMLQTILLSNMLLEEAFECPPTTPNDFDGFTNDTIYEEMLQNMLTKLLAKQSMEESAVSSLNDSMESCAIQGVDSQNLNT